MRTGRTGRSGIRVFEGEAVITRWFDAFVGVCHIDEQPPSGRQRCRRCVRRVVHEYSLGRCHRSPPPPRRAKQRRVFLERRGEIKVWVMVSCHVLCPRVVVFAGGCFDAGIRTGPTARQKKGTEARGITGQKTILDTFGGCGFIE